MAVEVFVDLFNSFDLLGDGVHVDLLTDNRDVLRVFVDILVVIVDSNVVDAPADIFEDRVYSYALLSDAFNC